MRGYINNNFWLMMLQKARLSRIELGNSQLAGPMVPHHTS